MYTRRRGGGKLCIALKPLFARVMNSAKILLKEEPFLPVREETERSPWVCACVFQEKTLDQDNACQNDTLLWKWDRKESLVSIARKMYTERLVATRAAEAYHVWGLTVLSLGNVPRTEMSWLHLRRLWDGCLQTVASCLLKANLISLFRWNCPWERGYNW